MRIPALALLLLLASCSRQHDAAGQRLTLTGKWKLVSYSVGTAGPGTWQDADPHKPSFIQFNPDGTVEYIPANQYAASRYSVISDSTLTFYRTTDTMTATYRLTPGSMILIGHNCIEGCAGKYVPVD